MKDAEMIAREVVEAGIVVTVEYTHTVQIMVAALKEATLIGYQTAKERAETAVRMCASLDENGYICEKSAAITAIRNMEPDNVAP